MVVTRKSLFLVTFYVEDALPFTVHHPARMLLVGLGYPLEGLKIFHCMFADLMLRVKVTRKLLKYIAYMSVLGHHHCCHSIALAGLCQHVTELKAKMVITLLR